MERILASKALEKIGKKIKLSGWVARVRDHGGLIFVDLRDWSGIIQLVIDPDNAKAFKAAKELGSEYVITVEGEVSKRDSSLQNANLRTGTIEVKVDTMEIVNTSKTPPLPLDGDGREIDEQTRLTYRYLDMRRGRVAGIMKKRHNLTMAIRNWMDSNEFTEITTPLLTSSSPEGARDFYVPSRLHKGKFFVLPQAPQQYKQLLMVGGVDKYFQIAPCARDEDPRADRHAGVFYQIDVEMSFPTIDKLFGTCENMIKDTYKAVAPDKEIIEFPFPRISYEDAMNTYGSDKPDLRYGLEVKDATEAIKGQTEFNVFESADVIKVINAPQSGGMSRKEIEEMEGYAKVMGAKGLAYVKVAGKKLESGIAKFLPAAVQEDIIKLAEAKDGDLLFFAADKWEVATKVMGEVRTRLGEKLELMDASKLSFAWITDFPFYEKDKDGNLDFGHNPFSMPKGGKEAFETDDPLSIISNQYDLAMNGYEILSGSIRNHDPEALVKAFEKVGYGEDEVKERFGGMYNAFQYGAPPHGGWAVGIDRYFMVLIDEPNIRDVYAFPKNSNGMDLMMNAPSTAPQADLDVLGIKSAMRGEEVASQILEKLEKSGAKYEYMEHKEVRTSQDAAEVRGSKLSDGAKSLVLHSKEYDDKYLMVVMPADKKGSLEKINKHMDEEFEVAKEAMINAIGLEVGGVPPFGRLLGMEVYFDQSMFKKKTSAFNIGTRTKSVVMGTKDLIKLAQPNKRSKEADLVV